MAINKKISELTAKATPVDADLFVLVDTEATPDETKKITFADLVAAIGPGVSDHALLSHLAYADAGHTGFEPTIAAGVVSEYRRGDKAWATLNQAAVAGLTTGDNPVFNYIAQSKKDSLKNTGFYSTIDFNTQVAGDFGLAKTDSTNGPGAAFYAVRTEALYSSTDLFQITHPFRGGPFYFRNYYGGAWGSWRRLLDTVNDIVTTGAAQITGAITGGSTVQGTDINATGAFKVDGTQVVTNRRPAIVDPSGGPPTPGYDPQARDAIISILGALRTHGLIAT